MDPDFRIYRDDEEKIPAEDKARLEGFLEAQARVGDMERLKDRIEALEAAEAAEPESKQESETDGTG